MKKIIIVEDEEILQNLLNKKLTEKGYAVEVAGDGEEGIQKIRETKPDLILLDIIMPKMGGFEVLEEMQKDESISQTPVIVVSNSGQPVEIDRAQKLGAKDWIVKTEFDPQEVIDKIINQIGEPNKEEETKEEENNQSGEEKSEENSSGENENQDENSKEGHEEQHDQHN